MAKNKFKIELNYAEIGKQFLKSEWAVNLCKSVLSSKFPNHEYVDTWKGRNRVNVKGKRVK